MTATDAPYTDLSLSIDGGPTRVYAGVAPTEPGECAKVQGGRLDYEPRHDQASGDEFWHFLVDTVDELVDGVRQHLGGGATSRARVVARAIEKGRILDGQPRIVVDVRGASAREDWATVSDIVDAIETTLHRSAIRNAVASAVAEIDLP